MTQAKAHVYDLASDYGHRHLDGRLLINLIHDLDCVVPADLAPGICFLLLATLGQGVLYTADGLASFLFAMLTSLVKALLDAFIVEELGEQTLIKIISARLRVRVVYKAKTSKVDVYDLVHAQLEAYESQVRLDELDKLHHGCVLHECIEQL